MLEIDKSQIKKDTELWKDHSYYEMAEEYMDDQWDDLVWPFIKDCDFGVVVELAPGRGRNSEHLIGLADELILVDICKENLDFCKDRLSAHKNFKTVKGNGSKLPINAKNSVDFIYCFDAMVHFEPEIVYNYLQSFSSVLKPGGCTFLHHSNYSGWCNDDWKNNPHARNFMHWVLFERWAKRAGFEIMKSEVIDWVDVKGLDRLTLLRKV